MKYFLLIKKREVGEEGDRSGRERNILNLTNNYK